MDKLSPSLLLYKLWKTGSIFIEYSFNTLVLEQKSQTEIINRMFKISSPNQWLFIFWCLFEFFIYFDPVLLTLFMFVFVMPIAYPIIKFFFFLFQIPPSSLVHSLCLMRN